MNRGTEIRCYDYVNRPYEQVRDALTKDALALFQSATRGAASRAQSVAAELRQSAPPVSILQRRPAPPTPAAALGRSEAAGHSGRRARRPSLTISRICCSGRSNSSATVLVLRNGRSRFIFD